jgi:hypothetical protein
MDRYGDLGQLDSFAPTSPAVTPLPRNPFCRIHWGALGMGAKQAGQLFPHPNFGDRLGPESTGDDLTGEIVGGGLNTEPRRGQVALGLVLDEPCQAGGPPDENHQETGREWVQRAGVPDCSRLQSMPHAIHHIV